MLLICMSIAGTVPLLICLFLWLIMRNRFPYRFGKRLLLISIVFYLAPIQLAKYLLPQQIVDYIRPGENGGYYMNIQNSISVHIGRQSLWMPRYYTYIAAGWLLAIFAFCVYEIIKYNHQIKILKESSYEKEVEIPSVGKRTILVTDHVSSPYTVGFLNVFIIFPENLLKNECAGIMLKHEYAHLMNRDSLMKLICLVIICLHWMNPLAILLLILYSIFSEFIADEIATAKCTKDEKKKYITMMIELSSEPAEMPIIWKNGFFSGKNILRKRMEFIMKKNTVSRLKRVFAACVACVTIIASSSTILAYSPLQATSGENSNIIAEDGEFMKYTTSDTISADFSESDQIFITESGIQIPINGNMVSPQAIICIHNYSTGTLNRHVSNNSGGCTIYVYNARRCEKCGLLEINELIKTVTYVKCTHL